MSIARISVAHRPGMSVNMKFFDFSKFRELSCESDLEDFEFVLRDAVDGLQPLRFTLRYLAQAVEKPASLDLSVAPGSGGGHVVVHCLH